MPTYTLPFEINSLCIDNAINVDMSKIQWNFFNNDIDKIFIYLRNLDLQYDLVTLDFSNCDTYIKEKFILQYVKSSIFLGLRSFDYTLATCIAFMNNESIQLSALSIFNKSELQLFVQRNYELLNKISHIIFSAITIYTMSFENKHIEILKTNNDSSLSTNIFNVLHYLNIFEIALMSQQFVAENYINYICYSTLQFISQQCKNSIFATLAYGKTTSDWKLFQSLIANAMAIGSTSN